MLVVLAECVPEPFLIMDESFSILAGNQEATRLSGLTDEELIGQFFHRLFPGIPIGEIAGWISVPTGPDGREVFRRRAEIARQRVPGRPLPVEISLTKAVVSRRTFVVALLKQSLESIPEA
jgi:PAS domain S-box-containing protein